MTPLVGWFWAHSMSNNISYFSKMGKLREYVVVASLFGEEGGNGYQVQKQEGRTCQHIDPQVTPKVTADPTPTYAMILTWEEGEQK